MNTFTKQMEADHAEALRVNAEMTEGVKAAPQDGAPETESERNKRINKLSLDLWDVYTCDDPEETSKSNRVWSLLLKFDIAVKDLSVRRIAELEAAIDSAEVEGSITSGGNLWRFWSDQALKVVEGNTALRHELSEARNEALEEAAGKCVDRAYMHVGADANDTSRYAEQELTRVAASIRALKTKGATHD